MTKSATEAISFNLSEFGVLLVTRDQGEQVRGRLMPLLQEYEHVEIVLDGVDAYTPSFIDEVLGKCMVSIGTDNFRKTVRLVASAPEVRKLVNLVLSNRSGKQLR